MKKNNSVRKIPLGIMVLAIACCCGLPMLEATVGVFQLLLTASRLAIILVCFLVIYDKAIRLDRVFMLGTLLILYPSVMTLIRQGDLTYALSLLMKPYALLLLLYTCLYSKNQNEIVKAFSRYILALVLIDIATIILFSDGMNIASYYSSLTWFLGYKTARLPYLLALMFLYGARYNRGLCSKKIKYIICAIAVIDSMLSRGSACTVAILIYSIYYLLDNIPRIALRRATILVISLFANIGFIMFSSSNILGFMINNILNKDETVVYRVQIWDKCLRLIADSPIFGNGVLTTVRYVSLTGYRLGTSAHNGLLTILVTGGLLYLIMYGGILWKLLADTSNNNRKIATGYVLASIIASLTSSVLVYNPFIYLPLLLNERINNEKQ